MYNTRRTKYTLRRSIREHKLTWHRRVHTLTDAALFFHLIDSPKDLKVEKGTPFCVCPVTVSFSICHESGWRSPPTTESAIASNDSPSAHFVSICLDLSRLLSPSAAPAVFDVAFAQLLHTDVLALCSHYLASWRWISQTAAVTCNYIGAQLAMLAVPSLPYATAPHYFALSAPSPLLLHSARPGSSQKAPKADKKPRNLVVGVVQTQKKRGSEEQNQRHNDNGQNEQYQWGRLDCITLGDKNGKWPSLDV
ncbi:uncharacterized protein SPSK_04530 [Sporothrix schenckii 1099-18]|uniref:Uncharacterized protein n=1 Tax=Sporothrix schenckii 1099-18 TaxID=1397361 RepID=A0A0F2M4W7_SPOSC|nr:uncharacterized protein SPSK_04530 [Sporothrix schenckii 1099-18]KJR83850.1 hypothetical protein SPSK_04530 [Sporothrix schenckii 1099-18]